MCLSGEPAKSTNHRNRVPIIANRSDVLLLPFFGLSATLPVESLAEDMAKERASLR